MLATRWSILLWVLLPTTALAQPDCRAAGADCSLREAAAQANVRIGAAANPLIETDAEYAAALALDFDSVTSENAMKWRATQPERGQYEFAQADALVDFAEANGMAVRGHTLLWDQDLLDSTPAYVTAISDPVDLRALVTDHIATVVGRYAGRVDAWDVVNEPLEQRGSELYGNVFHEVLGPNYIAEALALAHAADPAALLFVNEVLISYDWPKFDAFVALVEDLLAQGAPLHGVGIQAHFLLPPSPQQLHANLRVFEELGLIVELTELDIVVATPDDAAALEQQRRDYFEVASACLAVPACRRITLWGFTDRHTWIDGFVGPGLAPLPLDENYARKPAWFGLRDGLLARARPLAGKKLRIRLAKLAATSKDPAVLALEEGGSADPTLHGAVLQVSAADGFDASWSLPASKWKRRGARYVYKDRASEVGPVRKVALRGGRKLALSVRGDELGIELANAPTPVEIVLSTGNASQCFLFTEAGALKPGKSFRAGAAPAPGSCPPPASE